MLQKNNKQIIAGQETVGFSCPVFVKLSCIGLDIVVISFLCKQMCLTGILFKPRFVMESEFSYYMVKKRALPEVLRKVVEVNTLLDSGRAAKIQEAIDRVGISRSSYYKYKDDVFPLHEKMEGKTITFVMEMEDRPGLLSELLKIVADSKANVLSIHQSIPVNHLALVTLSVMVLPITDDISELFEKMGQARGIRQLKIISGE